MNSTTFYWFPDIGVLGVDTGGPYVDFWHGATLGEAVAAYEQGAPVDTVSVFDYAAGERVPDVLGRVREYIGEGGEGQ